MSNMCTYNTKSFPSDWDLTKWRFPISPFDRDEYAKTLTQMLMDQLETMQTQLDGFDPEELTPANSDIVYDYPSFEDFQGQKPPAPDPNVLIPDPPDRPDFLPLSGISKVTIPEWTYGDPVLDLPTIPDPAIPDFSKDAPQITYPALPTMDDLDTPVMAPLLPVTIPALEEVDFPYFDAVPPEINMVDPNINVSEGNNDYDSPLNDAVKDWLLNGVLNGGTGLAPDVEEAIFQRESERSLQAHNDRMTRIRGEFTKSHMPLPTSMLFALLSEQETDYTNKRLDVSRDIAIKQAELAQTNTHFIIAQAIAYEQLMIGWFNNVANRVLEASKTTAQLNIELFKAHIQKYNMLVDIYKAKAQVYEAVAGVAVKKIEAQRLKLEQARLTGEINKINVEVYKTQVDALTAFVNKYRAELDASKTYLEVELAKLNAYKTEVEAYSVRVNAAATYYKMFDTRVEAEKAKIQAYSAAADAYGKRIQGIKVGVDAETAVVNAEADVNKSLATIFDADIKGFAETVKSITEVAITEAKIYESSIRGYEAEAKVLVDIDQLRLKKIDTQLQEYKIEFDASLESIKLKVQQILDKWKMRFNVLETMAQVIAQTASAAMNSDALTTHMSEGYSYSQGNQVSCSDQHSYDETTI